MLYYKCILDTFQHIFGVEEIGNFVLKRQLVYSLYFDNGHI